MIYRLSLILLFVSNLIISQDLYVDNNTYIYSKDVPFFVNDDIRLEASNSKFHLRGDSQLLQNTDTEYNSDRGVLTVYQTQKTGVYEYNIWCSPIGRPAGGTTKQNESFVHIFSATPSRAGIRNPGTPTETTITSSVENFVPASTPTTGDEISTRWIYALKAAGGYADWIPIGNSEALLEPGYSFTMKGGTTPNNVLEFQGRPNTGTINIDVTFTGTDSDPNSGLDNQVETLAGNPYPSALDVKLFLSNATNQTVLDGAVYYWEQKVTNTHRLAGYEGGYGVYTPGTIGDLSDNGTYSPAPFVNYDNYGGIIGSTSGNTTDYTSNNSRRYAAIGQGFLVRSADNGGAAAGGTAVFSNSMRVYMPESPTNGSIFGRVKSKKKSFTPMSHNGIDYEHIINNPTIIPEIRIHTKINDTYYRENIIAFREGTSLSYNKFTDGTYSTKLASDAYFISDNKELVIKSIEQNTDTRIPFGLTAGDDNTKFSINTFSLKDVDDNVKIYIYDGYYDTYTSIKDSNFEVTLNKGIHNNRFEVTFKSDIDDGNVLDLEENELLKTLNTYQDNKNKTLIVSNPRLLDIKSIELFDTTGRLVIKYRINNKIAKYTYNTNRYSDGVYLTKITLNNGKVISNKIIISNKN